MPEAQQVAGGVAGAAVLLLSWLVSNGLHKIREGYVGVYWRGGALLDSVTYPGYHVKFPWLDTVAEVQITLQTDSVENIACGTSGGVTVMFDRIEVVNRLDANRVLNTVKQYGVNYDKVWIFDKIHHEVNQFCSKHSLQQVYIDKFDQLDEQLQRALQDSCSEYDTGVNIIAVRVTKPKIPEGIKRNYEAVEAEKTKLMIARERQKVVVEEAETEARRLKIEADREKAVREIEMDKLVMEQSKRSEMDLIKSKAENDRMRSKADAESYASGKLAEANKGKLTREYLTELLYLALTNNTKIYFGDSIPKMFTGLGQSWPKLTEGE